MDGLLLVDKPKGWTSFDVVAKVRGTLKQAMSSELGVVSEGQLKTPKVGHTGTLDPLATGLLVLCIGTYCKRAQEFSKLGKVYDTEMTLGITSTTDDGEGEKTTISTHQPTEAEVRTALEHFVGTIEQIPPIYSAIKVGGKRAYKLARAGAEVKMESRQVKVNSLQLVDYSYPVVRFTADVSSGTYVRSLVRDIGEILHTGAYMSELKRLSVGDFKLDIAMSMDDLTLATLVQCVQTLD